MAKSKYTKNKTEGSSIASGNDTHIGDKNITNNNYGYLALAIVVIAIAYFVVPQINIGTTPPSDEDPKKEEPRKTPIDSPLVVINPPKKRKVSINDKPKAKKTATKKGIEKPVDRISDFIDLQQNAKLAFFNSNQLELTAFKQAVKQKFISASINTSDNFFQASFQKKFGANILNFNSNELRELGLDKKLNCICQIEGKITYEKNEDFGDIAAIGKINIHLLNLTTAQLNTIKIDVRGAGMSEPAALESLEEHLLQSKKLTTFSTNQCK